MGPMQLATGSYINLPFLSGFQDGYNTMDLLATLLFGATVINAIKLKGDVYKRQLVPETSALPNCATPRLKLHHLLQREYYIK